MKTKRILALFLMLAMLIGMMPMSVFAYSEDYFYDEETSIDVSTDGKVYSIYTEDNLEQQNGTTFLYVVKSGDRYYTLGNPRYTEFKEADSVYAVDITEYYDAQTNTFSGISNNVNVGVMQYQQNSGSYMYLDGDMLFALSVPFESKGETWFDGGIRYYPPDQTYSYSRPLWQANGDGTGYLYDSYIDWYSDSDLWVYGVLDLKFDGVDYRFALRDKSAEYNEAKAADPDNYNISVDVTAYLYAAPCGHEQNIHSEAVAPTCMDKGCEEYWYCRLCNGYFADSKFSKEIGHIPVLPALDHTYGPEGCINCGRSTPVYTKVTSYDQFRTLDPNASFIAVAEIDNGNGGKDYYVLKKEIGTSMADIDEDGNPDILQIDENSNGVADVLEIDANGDGIPDAMDYDGFYDGELDGVLDNDEIWEYLFYLEREYTDGYIPGIHVLSAIPVTPAADGSISVLGLDALEWIMERKISDEELYDQYYDDGATVKDYENDFCFRIPNFWIRSVVTIDNNYYQQPYDQGDSKWWGVLFGKDGKELDSYLYEPIYGESYPDDAVILYTEAFYSLNTDGQLEHALRFLINGEEKNFIMTSDSFWEEIEGTQYPIYLYCSDPGQPVHEHSWGPWTKVNDDVHERVCTVEGCSAFDLASHNRDESKGCTPDEDNYKLGHWVTCTDCASDYHEYHTRKTLSGSYRDYWEDAGDGIYHVIYCTECEGPVEYEEHKWTSWYLENTTNETRRHMRRCTTYACYRYQYSTEHIYDDGEVTTEPTCLTPGVKTYTCIADECTHSYTEEIPATGHDWGEWTPNENDATKEIRICKNDPTHTEERLAHEHEWSEWKNDEVSETHSRTCQDTTCGKTETKPHGWDDGVETKAPTCTEAGVKTFTCSDCNVTKTEDIPALDHDFGDWTYDSVDSHIRHCKRENCNAEDFGGHEWGNWVSVDENTHKMTCSVCNGYQTDDHEFDNGVVTKEPTEWEEGVKTYTCGLCSHTKTEPIDKLVHECTWTDWYPNGDENHKRDCMDDNCDQFETLPHEWDDGVITTEPTCKEKGVKTFTCQVCMHTRTEDVPTTDHEFGDWTPNNDGKTHSHFCSCNESETADHKFDDGIVTENPTHTNPGIKTYTCGDCGYSYAEEIPALTDHAWGEWVINKLDNNTHIRYCICNESQTAPHSFDEGKVTEEATHTHKGTMTFTCTDCGYSYTEEIPETTEHEWGEWVINKLDNNTHIRYCICNESQTAPHNFDEGKVTEEATHTSKGTMTFTCADCGYTYDAEIPATPDHEWTDWASNQDGTHTRSCRCNATETKSCTWNAGVITKQPTHYEEGEKTFTCTACGHTKTESVAKTNAHEWSDWAKKDDHSHIRECKCGKTEIRDHRFDNGKVTTAATHTSKGVKTFTCADCGYTYTEDIPETPDHEWTKWAANDNGTHTRSCRCNATETKNCTWDEGKITTEPTHSEEGEKTLTCTACGNTKVEKVPVLTEHKWGEWVINKLDEANTHIHFCICNQSETAPHNFDAGKITVEATHTSKGVKTYTCTDGCGYSYTEEIPATPDHEWSTWVPNDDGTHTRSCRCNANETKNCEWDDGKITQQPTHVEPGSKTYTCTVCGNTKAEEIPTTSDHEWTDWAPDKDGTHTRSCACNQSETVTCTWDEGTLSVDSATGGFQMAHQCTVCKNTNYVPVTGATVHFENCEGLEENSLVFVQSGDETTYRVTLPSADDISARDGYVFIGWTASIDGITYSGGNELFIKYADGVSITFTAEWATVLDEGEHELEEGTAYYVAGESFELDGEGIVYRGEQVFYVSKNGKYTLVNLTKKEEADES